jgi:hypothetical protein
MRRAALALLFAAAGCAAHAKAPPRPAADARSDPAFRVGRSSSGLFELAWRPLGGSVPRNQPFELEVFLYSRGALLTGAELAVSGWMDAHGHGLTAAPLVQETAPGRYLVSGLLLHMRGTWRLAFDIVRDGYSERVEFAVEVAVVPGVAGNASG